MEQSEIRGRWFSSNATPDFTTFIRATRLRKRRKRNVDRRIVSMMPHQRMRLASSGTRSPVGVPPRLWLRRTNATTQLRARFLGRDSGGRYPPSSVPVQRASRRPVVMPAGRVARSGPGAECKSARGHRTRSTPGLASRRCPSMSEIRGGDVPALDIRLFIGQYPSIERE
jgi:hypothetical protein